MIGQFAYLVCQIHSLSRAASAQQVSRVRVAAIERVEVALHAALLLRCGLTARELIEVLVEQMLRRGRGTTRSARHGE